MSNGNKPLVIYHQDCLDGFGAAYAFWKTFGDNAEYYPGVYSHRPPSVWGRDVYLVDFSYPRAVVEHMVMVAKSVTLIDHHKAAIDDLKGIFGLNRYTDTKKSGCVLAWEYCVEKFFLDEKVGSKETPSLLLSIEDRDLWKFDLDNTKEVTAGLMSYDFEFSTWDFIINKGISGVKQMESYGKVLLRKHAKDLADTLRMTTRFVKIGEHTVPLANVPPMFTSDAGDILGNGQKFAVLYYDTMACRKFSLRSRKDQPQSIEVDVIAQMFGGNGHPNAAGFTVNRDHNLAHI